VGRKLLDTATVEIAIRKISKRKEERSVLIVSSFEDSRDQHLTIGFAKLQILISQEQRGDPVRVCCGCRFPDREIEELFKVLRASGKGKILC
jgi:hypothetical protein